MNSFIHPWQECLSCFDCNALYHVLVSKLANTRINEFMNSRMERPREVVNADEMLGPSLKAFALVTKCKLLLFWSYFLSEFCE